MQLRKVIYSASLSISNPDLLPAAPSVVWATQFSNVICSLCRMPSTAKPSSPFMWCAMQSLKSILLHPSIRNACWYAFSFSTLSTMLSSVLIKLIVPYVPPSSPAAQLPSTVKSRRLIFVFPPAVSEFSKST